MTKLYSKLPVGFVYLLDFFNPDGKLVSSETTHNIVPVEGLNYIAGAAYGGAAQVASWYLSLYGGNYTPLASLTAANYPAAASEFLGYSEPTRVPWVAGTVSGGAITNVLAKAEFTWNATGTAYGGVLTSAQPKSSVSGVIGSAVRFPTPKIGDAGSVLRVTAGVAFTSL